ncbi:phage tail protein [uncultured Desulfovibrio sp.]|uniref:phage tail protein n=1 Tax=uncultured Desulfovibrio sp. TaxID=167968 RepID=UPI00205640D6|nr:phage tail protein [uncultured Desulfovibrio sp.]DAJ56743.1 MAG TPA: hypothetical protein [Caudoviricetes sp.]
MAIKEFVGAVVLEVNGQEVECSSFSDDTDTGRKPVKTMNRKRRIAGYCTGVATYSLTVSVPIPVDGEEMDWENVVDAKLVIYPVNGKGQRKAYTGCVVEKVGDKYESEGEAKRDLTMFAVDKVKE